MVVVSLVVDDNHSYHYTKLPRRGWAWVSLSRALPAGLAGSDDG